MKRMSFTLTLAALLVLPLPASAQKQANKTLGTLISTTTLDAASSVATVDPEDALGYGLLILSVTVSDSNDSVTAISMACTSDIGGNDYSLQECSVSSGAATCYNATWTFDPSGESSPKRWAWRVDIEGFRGVECTFTDTGGLVADSIVVVGHLATKG